MENNWGCIDDCTVRYGLSCMQDICEPDMYDCYYTCEDESVECQTTGGFKNCWGLHAGCLSGCLITIEGGGETCRCEIEAYVKYLRCQEWHGI